MSEALGKRCVWGLCGLLAFVLMTASATRAEVSTDLSGTIVVYPKVLNDGTRDTVIQLTNTSNLPVYVSCYYVNARLRFPGREPGPLNPRLCQETDFHLYLTKQQPTHWVASEGRFVIPGEWNADGAGLDPGGIPPVPGDFEGELRCVQVDVGGNPWPGNALKGEALLRNTATGDVSKYNAVSILASDAVANDNDIMLDNTPDTNNGEANSCNDVILLNHIADGAPSPVIQEHNPTACDDPADGNCPVTTELTLVPCSIDLENQIPGRVTVQFEITNEFEEHYSSSTTVECWLNEPLTDIAPTLSYGFLGSTAAYTQILPVATDGGVIGIAEEFHSNDTTPTGEVGAGAAWDLQAEGNFISGRWLPRTRFDATLGVPGGPVVDHIIIPEIF